MKKWVFQIGILLFIFLNPIFANAENSLLDISEQWLNDEDLQVEWKKVISSYREYLPISEDRHWLDAVRDGTVFSNKSWLRGITDFFIHEWIVNRQFIVMLIFL